MSEYSSNTPAGEEMDRKLWDHIDGLNSDADRSSIEELIRSNTEWRNKYHELLEVHKLMQSSELEQPSMRFTKNVMEEIARYHIAPATKTYINNKIIWGIGTFFVLMIVGFIIYGVAQVNWTTGDSSSTEKYTNLLKVDYSRIFNNTYMNIFMMLNVILGLFLLDRYLANKRKQFHKEA